MKIAIVGYGKMGRMIETAALAAGHEIVSRIDPFALEADARDIASATGLDKVDVAIEFTRPDTAVANIRALTSRGVSVVVGTTGWLDQLDAVSAEVLKANTGLMWSANYSLGVNLFYKIAEAAARLFDPFAEYDVGGWESHHNKKADSPSGTAKTLVEKVLAEMTRKTTPVYEALADRPPRPEELHYASLRVGSVPGTHTLFFDSPSDTVEITHTARSREGLARGAVLAAEWLGSKKGIYTMDDVLSDVLCRG